MLPTEHTEQMEKNRMSELTDMTAAARPVRLCGKEYLLSPMSLGDFAEFDAWAEEQFWQKKQGRVARMPEEMRAKLLERAFDEFDEARVSVRAMMTIAGTARLVWLSLRKCHPAVTPEQAAELVTLETRVMVQATLDKLNGLESDAKGGEGKPDPPARKAAKKGGARGKQPSES